MTLGSCRTSSLQFKTASPYGNHTCDGVSLATVFPCRKGWEDLESLIAEITLYSRLSSLYPRPGEEHPTATTVSSDWVKNTTTPRNRRSGDFTVNLVGDEGRAPRGNRFGE